MCLGINMVASPVVPQAPQEVQGQAEVKKLSADRFKMFQGKGVAPQQIKAFRPHQARMFGEPVKRLARNLMAARPAVKTPVARMNGLIREVNDLASRGAMTLNVEAWALRKLNELKDVERQLMGEMESDCRDLFEKELGNARSKGKSSGAGEVATRKEAARSAARTIIEGLRESTKSAGLAQTAYIKALNDYVDALCAPIESGKGGKSAYDKGVRRSRECLLKAEVNLQRALIPSAEASDEASFAPVSIRAKILSLGNEAKLNEKIELQNKINVFGRAFRALSPDLRKAVRMEISKESMSTPLDKLYGKGARDAVVSCFGNDVGEVLDKYALYEKALTAFVETPTSANKTKLKDAGVALSDASASFRDAFDSNYRRDKTATTLGGFVKTYVEAKGAGVQFPAEASEKDLKVLKEFLSRCRDGEAAFKALTGQDFLAVSKKLRAPGLKVALQHLEQMSGPGKGPFLFTGAEVAKALTGGSASGRVSNRAMALAMGARSEDISDAIDANLYNVSPLGKGSMNDVLKFTVGTGNEAASYVFKPELAGATGLQIAPPSVLAHYDSKQGMVGLNIATCKMAGLIGCPTVVVDSKAMVVNGKYGLQMELAGGTEAGRFTVDDSAKKGIGVYTKLVKRLGVDADIDSEERRKDLKLANSLFKQATDLQWLDRLTVQGDRHGGNYKVDFGENGETVSLKGIDNDQAFPTGQPSISRFTWDAPEDISRFVTGLVAKLGYVNARTAQKDPIGWLKNAMNENPNKLKAGTRGITIEGTAEKPALTIDLANCSPAVRTVLIGVGFGFRNIGVPPVMSKSMYDTLMNLDKHQATNPLGEVIGESLDGLVSEKSIKSTASRLMEMIKLAKEYKLAGRIVSDDGWTDAETAKQLMGKLKAASGAVDYVAANYAARDFYELVDVFVPKKNAAKS